MTCETVEVRMSNYLAMIERYDIKLTILFYWAQYLRMKRLLNPNLFILKLCEQNISLSGRGIQNVILLLGATVGALIFIGVYSNII